MALNAQELQGRWNQLKGQVKEKWGQLTDEDLQITGGNIDQLVGRIQEKTGVGREEIERFLGTLTERGGAAIAQAAESARGFAQQAGERFREGYSQFADQARSGYGTAEDWVRHRPGPSMASAFGLGLLMGVVVGLAVRSR